MIKLVVASARYHEELFFQQTALSGNRYDVVPGDDVPPPAPASQPPPLDSYITAPMARYEEPPLEVSSLSFFFILSYQNTLPIFLYTQKFYRLDFRLKLLFLPLRRIAHNFMKYNVCMLRFQPAAQTGLPATGDPLSPPAHPLGSTGLTAVAIYDYQKQDDDEISFDPDDIITNIDQVAVVHTCDFSVFLRKDFRWFIYKIFIFRSSVLCIRADKFCRAEQLFVTALLKCTNSLPVSGGYIN